MEGLGEYKRERAARLYKERRVSIAGAAELAGLTVREMADYLIRKGYKSCYSYEDLEKQILILFFPKLHTLTANPITINKINACTI